MEPSQVAASYCRIADRWTHPDFDRADGIQPLLRAIGFTVERDGALDVGCGGNGRFLALLQSQGFAAVQGLDLSHEMLRLLRASLPNVALCHADICDWQASRHYALISAWDSIWHVPLARQASVLLKLCAALAPGGVLLFSAGGLEVPDERRDAHMGVPMYTATLGVPRLLSLLQEGGCALRHFEYDQHPQVHVYVIAQKRAAKAC